MISRIHFGTSDYETGRGWRHDGRVSVGDTGRRPGPAGASDSGDRDWDLRCFQLEPGIPKPRVSRMPIGESSVVCMSHDLSYELCGAMAVNVYDGVCSVGNAPSATLCARLACEYMADHLDASLSLEEISEAAGLGIQALERCFKESFRISPRACLHLMRSSSMRAGRS